MHVLADMCHGEGHQTVILELKQFVWLCVLLSWLLSVLTFSKVCPKTHSTYSFLPFFSELEGIHARELREIASVQRSKTVITGDMMPLVDALPHMEERGHKSGAAPSKSAPRERRSSGKYTKRCEICRVVVVRRQEALFYWYSVRTWYINSWKVYVATQQSIWSKTSWAV